MSIELYSSESHFEDEESRIQQAAAMLSLEVIEAIGKASGDYPSGEQYRGNASAFIKTGALLSQLEVLGGAIALATKQQRIDDQPFLLMDPAHFTTLEQAARQDIGNPFLFTPKEDREQWIIDGMREATDIILSKLVPEELLYTGTLEEDTFYLRLRRDLLERVQRQFIHHFEDGGCEVFLPTNLPNLYVTHVYPPGVYALPIEELRLISPSVHS